MARSRTVSYTHLDVYKRQGLVVRVDGDHIVVALFLAGKDLQGFRLVARGNDAVGDFVLDELCGGDITDLGEGDPCLLYTSLHIGDLALEHADLPLDDRDLFFQVGLQLLGGGLFFLEMCIRDREHTMNVPQQNRRRGQDMEL